MNDIAAAIRGLPVSELASIGVNLTLLLSLLFFVSARRVFQCLVRVGPVKDESAASGAPIRRNGPVDGEATEVRVGTDFKAAVLCCF